MLLSKVKRPSRRIGNSYIIWFQESNAWIQFEEPAWFVYRMSTLSYSLHSVSQLFQDRYQVNKDKSLLFVTDIINQVSKLSSVSFVPETVSSAVETASPQSFFSVRYYKFRNKRIKISYGSSKLEYMIHPSFSHLEINTNSNPHFLLDIYAEGSRYLLKIDDLVWEKDDPNHLKRKLFIELTNLIYNKSEKDWLAYIHGSAISNEHETIVLSTACGSGKSTLAALLCKNGLQFVADDYVPIDARSCKAYPFPAALSVKDGSFPILLPLYDKLKDAQVYHFKGTNKTVKYLTFPDSGSYYKPLPVRNMVFVIYDSSKPWSFRKVPTLEAIKRFNDEAWLSPTPAHARKFIKWFPGIQCYELVYSDNERAIKEIKNLFKTPLAKKDK